MNHVKPNLFVRALARRALDVAIGAGIILGTHIWNHYCVEGAAAAAVGALALARSRDPLLVSAGGFAAAAGWMAGLPVSIALSERIGLGAGPWFLAILAVFAVPAAGRLIRRKPFRAAGVLAGGIVAGLAVEIVQMLPLLVGPLKFADPLGLGVLCASALAVPWAGSLSRKEPVHG